MDFVKWCGEVLRAVLEAQDRAVLGSMKGVRFDALSSMLKESAGNNADPGEFEQAVLDAHRHLSGLGLLDDRGYSIAVPREMRDVALDQVSLWQEARAINLRPQEEALLRILNEQGEQRRQGFAFLRDVPYSKLGAGLDAADKRTLETMVDELVRDLDRLTLADLSPYSDSLTAKPTYMGLAWEHRGGRTRASAIPSDLVVTAEPIWRARGIPVNPALCFVLMPFREQLDTVFQDHIKPTVESVSLDCIRADDIYGVGLIMEDIWTRILSAGLLLADMTGRNANVFYELGIAHTLGKKVVLITQSLEDVPFDLRHHRCIPYTFTPRGMKKFQEDLKQTLLSELG